MLTVDSAAAYFLDRGMLDVRAVIDGDLEITSATRRNRNLRVLSRDAAYLVKQISDGTAWEESSIAREARFYDVCARSATDGLRCVLPPLKHIDPDEGIVVYELLRDAIPVWRYYREHAEGVPLRTDAVSAVGGALAALHAAFGTVRERAPAFIGSDLPWSFWLGLPNPDLRRLMSRGCAELLRLLQEDAAVVDFFESLRERWTPSAVIHGDVRLDNVLVLRDEAADARIALVDWETVQWGDPAWDLAGALQDSIFLWISSMPLDREADEMAEAARYPLPVLQAGMRACLERYRSELRLDPAAAAALIERAVQFSAARLLQTSYEIAINDVAVSPITAHLLQVAVNVIRDPRRACGDLYGLDVGVGAA